MSINYKDIHKPLRGSTETLTFNGILRRMQTKDFEGESEPFNLDPDYQRPHVWTNKQQSLFVGYLLEGNAAPTIVINRDLDPNHYPPNVDELVDGKQRLMACYRFIVDEIPAELSDGREVWLKDADATERRQILGISGPYMNIVYVSLSRPEVLKLYLRLNRGGTVHTDSEIQHVRNLLAAEENGNV